MKNVVIFGCKDVAQLAKFYLENDEKYKYSYKVVAFSVNKEFLANDKFEGLPVIAFEDIENHFDKKNTSFFAPMTGVKMNDVRQNIYNQIKSKGYDCISYISSRATILTQKIGENCFILEDNTIQPFVEIGNNVVLWSGNHIGHHSVIKDNVFFTSHVVLSGHCEVRQNSWIGVNATIRDGVVIGEKTLVAMGSLITKDTESNGFYMGTPAKKQDKKSIEVY